MMVEYKCYTWGNYRTCDEFGADITEDVITSEISFTFAMYIGRGNPFRYFGYYYDEETNMNCLQSRYYNTTGYIHNSRNAQWSQSNRGMDI